MEGVLAVAMSGMVLLVAHHKERVSPDRRSVPGLGVTGTGPLGGVGRATVVVTQAVVHDRDLAPGPHFEVVDVAVDESQDEGDRAQHDGEDHHEETSGSWHHCHC